MTSKVKSSLQTTLRARIVCCECCRLSCTSYLLQYASEEKVFDNFDFRGLIQGPRERESVGCRQVRTILYFDVLYRHSKIRRTKKESWSLPVPGAY